MAPRGVAAAKTSQTITQGLKGRNNVIIAFAHVGFFGRKAGRWLSAGGYPWLRL
jgi:hypothetical protein